MKFWIKRNAIEGYVEVSAEVFQAEKDDAASLRLVDRPLFVEQEFAYQRPLILSEFDQSAQFDMYAEAAANPSLYFQWLEHR